VVGISPPGANSYRSLGAFHTNGRSRGDRIVVPLAGAYPDRNRHGMVRGHRRSRFVGVDLAMPEMWQLLLPRGSVPERVHAPVLALRPSEVEQALGQHRYVGQDDGTSMKPGIEIETDVPGHGAVAERGKTVVIRYDGFLHRGDSFQKGQVSEFVLGKRDVIAGLEYGVEGMRVGGRRRFHAAPHLCYREDGVPGVIPSNALLTFDVELVAVRD
jgi:hypothetical protein